MDIYREIAVSLTTQNKARVIAAFIGGSDLRNLLQAIRE